MDKLESEHGLRRDLGLPWEFGRRRKSTAVAVLAGVLSLWTSGCATLLEGSTQKVRLFAEPPYTKAVINGSVHGGNSSVDLSTDEDYVIEFKKDGYQSVTTRVESSFNPVFLANLLLGPAFPLGMLVDLITGASSKLDKRDVRVTLAEIPSASHAPDDQAQGSLGLPNIADGTSPRHPQGNPLAGAGHDRGSDGTAPRAPSRTDSQRSDSERPSQTSSTQSSADPPSPSASPSIDRGGLDTPAREDDIDRAWVVAVMPVHPTSPVHDPVILTSLTDQLRVYLGTHRIRVIDRGVQEAALSRIIAEEKERSYAQCIDDACQIPLGKALAATHVLRASIARFGATCTMNGELVDLAKEVTISAGSARSDCSEEGALDAAGELVRRLVDHERATSARL